MRRFAVNAVSFVINKRTKMFVLQGGIREELVNRHDSENKMIDLSVQLY